ncbi:WAT1-related protein At1g43650 [Impatiens glandulifera]|uniref:WAT1-related protein At1g43650 n=1 Tax=Impatiens glandulifera TaxID=253017 RepID=UPI001FB15F01|nr:WAT1-related protein At1g43650 [Impatiens glandulifera]
MERNKVYAIVFFIQCVYAGMALFSKAAISKGMNPYVFVVYRQAFATTALAPFALLVERNKSCPMSFTLLFKIFLVSLFGITLSLNLYYYAMTYTSATYAAATTNMIPSITFIIAFIFGLETINIKKWNGVAKIMGTVMGVCGALVFAFVKGPTLNFFKTNQNIKNNNNNNDINSKGDHEWVKGSLLMLLANTAWSFWLVIQVPIVKQYPMKLRLTALQCLLSCLQSTVFAVAMVRDVSDWKIGWDIHLLSVAYCGVVVTGITYWLQVWVIEKRGPVFTAIFTPLALLLTAIFSALLWNEIFHLGSVCGVLLLVGGLYGVLWGKSKEIKLETIQQKTEETKELESITTTN